ncbi:MAG: noncanonical pyrimidine nucleotidase, YjjG family [Flavobacteriales bacterium]|nr:noncanonical pyrimidine nucleotidase, YjjG family [Flavobacteriales bacterium]
MNNYEHIFFDLDNTLWDFEANSKDTLEELFETYLKKDLPEVEFNELFSAYVTVNGSYWNKYRHGKVSKEDLRVNRFHDTLSSFGLDEFNLAEKISEEYLKICPLKAKLVEGAMEILDHIVGLKIPMVVITNGFDEVQHIKMENCGLTPFFEAVVTSEKIGSKKPYPEIFQHAFSTVGAKAARSLMIGDNHDSDIVGANNIGMDSAYLKLGELPDDFRGRWIIEKLSELKEIV